MSAQTSQRSSGAVLRLEELVETLQDRRRRMDQDLRPQLQSSRDVSSRDVSSRDQSDVRLQEIHLHVPGIFWSGDVLNPSAAS